MLKDTLPPLWSQHLIISTTCLMIFIFVHIPTWLHEPLIQMMEKVCFWYFKSVFLSFLTMLMHAQACVCWSKYTTTIFSFSNSLTINKSNVQTDDAIRQEISCFTHSAFLIFCRTVLDLKGKNVNQRIR